MTNTGSVEAHVDTSWPGPTLRCTMVPERGARTTVVSALIGLAVPTRRPAISVSDLAEDAEPVARGLESNLAGFQITDGARPARFPPVSIVTLRDGVRGDDQIAWRVSAGTLATFDRAPDRLVEIGSLAARKSFWPCNMSVAATVNSGLPTSPPCLAGLGTSSFLTTADIGRDRPASTRPRRWRSCRRSPRFCGTRPR